VTLETELVDDLPPVLAGRVEVQQVLMNLLLNALRALDTVRQRHVRVGTGRDGARALVWVQDSGPGVPQEQLDTVFDSFSTSKADGLGMGLAACRRIIEAHGSRIWAENPEGGGARFSFTLPLDEQRGSGD
jgi:signal transduction histidine kinase